MKQPKSIHLPPCEICDNESFTFLSDIKDHFLSGEIFSLYKCNSCGLISTFPAPAEFDLPKYYLSEKYISHSARPESLFEFLYQTIRKYTLKHKAKLVSKYAGGKNLLDIGCATGEFLMACKNRGFEVSGVEPNKKAREIAAKFHSLKIEDLQALSEFEDHTYDVISMWHVLEHVRDINQRFEEIHRLLKKDGVLIIALPNPESYDAEHYKSYWAAYDVPRHLYHFNENALKTLSIKHGFHIQKILPMKFDAFYISLLSEKYKTGKGSFLKAFYWGFKSNLYANQNHRGHSSLIYILSKK
ncbi:MAG: class I SAM-dependent methyltransferase [Lentimicrobium sp.]|nr:class I SAM-dependent methyltransferase [Lentimicrobium sp.]